MRKLDLKRTVRVRRNHRADEEIVGEIHELPRRLRGSQEFRQDDTKRDREDGTEWRRGCGISQILRDLTTHLLRCEVLFFREREEGSWR